MTLAVGRYFFLLLAGIPLAGCSLPALNMFSEKEAELFAQGLDQYITSDNLENLKQLPQQYPQGEWRSKAEAIIDMAEEQRQLQTELDEKGKRLDLCRAEKNGLRGDNRKLEETLKRLKEALIDSEKQTE